VKLAEVLRPEHVVVPLPGGPLSAAAIALVQGAGLVESDGDDAPIVDRLRELGSEDLVVHPGRAFILHMRTDAVSKVLLFAGASVDPICRDLGDNETQCARLVFIVLAPPRRAAEHLQLLGALGRFLSSPVVAEDILAHASPEELAVHLAALEFELPEQLRVRDIMSAHPRTTTPDASLRGAAREMVRSSLGALIVVDAEMHVVGMLGEKELMRDLLTNYLQGGTAQRDAPASTGRRKVRDVMTRLVLGVSPGQPLSEVAAIMVNKDVERVPIVEDGILTGVITRADIVRKLIGY
jgi:CBS domain-containing protein/mannitol/fructose-specific phosphotransferase system IIA component (Ntr-type)